ncbi:hypothetical protein AK812_SmicGene26178 [Symbiodinium microadriaticum]|uniref:PDZ domain-containing protein n=1 Tax=Symbiodinium microadriaticum TaxID=2951 RepID=A0A1Q9DA34_SYMMI|nr:hypothetical protein AK812_SmicGene26178 [Symbiodinium microadriaticum]
MKGATSDDVSDWIASQVEDQLACAWHLVVDRLNSTSQGQLSFACAIVGSVLVLCGSTLVKPVFVTSLSVALAVRIEEVAATQQSSTAGGICAVLVAACSCVLAHRFYPVVLFLAGGFAAGLGTIFLRESLNLEHAQKELLALSVLVAVAGGLLLKEFRLAGWCLLTPVVGAYLLATSCQFWEEDRAGRHAMWSSVGAGNSLLFAAIWSLGTLLGWYCQLIGPAFGEDPLKLPAALERKLQHFHVQFPFLLDAAGQVPARQRRTSQDTSTAYLTEPFLKGAARLEAKARPGKGWSGAPKLLISFGAVIVLLLNAALISQPVLVLGHAVLMSLAFLPLTTAGLLSYARDRTGCLVMEPLLRHAAHASLGVLVLLCAILGCLSMYWKRLCAAEPRLSPTWSSRFHVFVGYAVLMLLFACSCSGAAKLVALQRGSERQDVGTCHSVLGKLIFILAAFNQVQGCFLPHLLPVWVASLLTVLLVICVTAVLAFLCSPPPTIPPRAAAPVKEEVRRAQLLGRLIRGQAPSKLHHGAQRKLARRDWDAVVAAFEVQDTANMVSLCFLRWHRFAQSAHITKAHADLRSSDNIVNFLSSTLLGEMSRLPLSLLTWCLVISWVMPPGKSSVRDCDEKELVVEESVDSLGFGFVDLPPTKYAPLVIKNVKKDSWAADAGILVGSELLELNGQEAGQMSAEDFRAALKQRPLRVKLAPPMAEAWKQVANFQQQVVTLSLQKVHLQQALKDESERVKKELGICTALEKSNSLQHKAQRVKDLAERDLERRALEERLLALQAELDAKKAELEGPKGDAQEEESRLRADLERETAEVQETKAALDAERAALQQEKTQVAKQSSELEALRIQLEAKASAQAQREAELDTKEASVREELERLESLAALEVVEEELSKGRASLLAAQPLLQLLEAEVEGDTGSASPGSPPRPASPSRSQRPSQTSTRMSIARQSLTAARMTQLKAAAAPVQEADDDSEEMF